MLSPKEVLDQKSVLESSFSPMIIAIETKDTYDFPNKKFETYYVDIYCYLDVVDDVLNVIASRIYGEVHEKIERGFIGFQGIFYPQPFDNELNISLFSVQPSEYFSNRQWSKLLKEDILAAVEYNIKSIQLLTSDGKEKELSFVSREVYRY